MARAALSATTAAADALTSVELAPMTAAKYERFALDHTGESWELWQGIPRKKPAMTWNHNDVAFEIGFLLGQQLDRRRFRIRVNSSRVHRPDATYYIPDVLVVPVELGRSLKGRPDILETFQDPLPLVVEVWSPSTGDYDIHDKLPTYQARGDLEIWRIHPYDQTITAWRQQPDGTSVETIYRDGTVSVASLPGVEIELATLFQS